MEENENLYDKIKELFGAVPGQFSSLEEKIDIDLQMKYFEFSRKIKNKSKEQDFEQFSTDLFDEHVSETYKQELLSRLASMEKVEAFRIIEKFMENPPPELRDWGILAMQESKMLLESKFLDENQVFISTGLGGKGDKLRYFIVLIGNKIECISEIQKKIIRNEFGFTLKKYNAEIEKYRFSKSLATIMAMVPMQATIKTIFEEAIAECNLYGNFLLPNFIITNVKELSFSEIRDFLEKQRREEEE
jgi:hypothetical protein